jgi:hypothetical protein
MADGGGAFFNAATSRAVQKIRIYSCHCPHIG